MATAIAANPLLQRLHNNRGMIFPLAFISLLFVILVPLPAQLMDLLLKKGAVVSYNDPHIPSLPRMRHWPHLAMDSTPLTAEYLAAQDCVLIATDHTAYDYEFVAAHSRLVIDTRNATRGIKAGREKVIRA